MLGEGQVGLLQELFAFQRHLVILGNNRFGVRTHMDPHHGQNFSPMA